MPDPRDIAQRINILMRDDAQGATDAAALAAAYARFSRQAHARLVRCQTLLTKGLRSEAVQECETEPDLLTLAAALELDDLRGWSDFCRKRDLETPYVQPTGIVAELNRAYAADQLVGPLMREYRLRCAVRAPLHARIVALRALAGVDHGNRVWTEDLITLEQARLQQIPGEVDAALGDVERLQELQRELIDDRRKVPAPPKLLARVEECLLDSRVARAQQELEAMMPALSEAYSAMDFVVCESLLATWTQTLKSVGRGELQVPAVLRDRVEPIMRWVEQQATRREQDTRFHAACTRLANVVRDDGPSDQLEHALADAASFERPLPGDLERDAREELALRAAAAQRRRRLRATLATAAVLLVCAIGAVVTWQQLRQRHVDQRLAAMDEALQRVELSAASAIWDELSAAYPENLERATAQDAKRRLDHAVTEQAARRDRFLVLQSRLQDTADEDLDAASIDRLESLVGTDEQRGAAARQRERFDQAQARLAQRNDTQALERAAALRTRLDETSSDELDADPAGVMAFTASVVSELDTVRRQFGLTPRTIRVLDAVESHARQLGDNALAVRDLQERQRQMAGMLGVIANQGGSPEQLKRSLAAFTDTFPDSPLTSAFTEATEAAPAWRAVDAWRGVVASWKPEDLAPATLKDAVQRLRDADVYIDAHPSSPMLDAVRGYRQYWGTGLLASADDGPWLGELPVLLRAPIFRDLGVATTRDGRRYYVRGNGNRRETSLGTTIEVVLTPDTTRTTTLNFEPGVLGPVEPSPQSELATELLAMVADYEFREWDSFPARVVDTVASADEVDAVLRAEVIKLLVRNLEAATGSADPELIRLRDQIAAHGDATVNWLDPENITVQATRRHLEGLLSKPVNTEALRRRHRARRAALHAAVAPDVVGHGVLLPGDNGVSTVAVPRDARSGLVELWAVVPGEDDEPGRFRWITLGQAEDSKVSLSRVADRSVPRGSRVWFVRNPQSEPDTPDTLVRPAEADPPGGGT